MRKPKVENKYNLTISKIKKMKVINRDKVKSPLFWRNNVVNAWCISKEIGTKNDIEYGTSNEYWIGIYDNKDQIKISFSTYGGMCGYDFNVFFKENEIECENDILVQEQFLEKINYLIDEKIIA